MRKIEGSAAQQQGDIHSGQSGVLQIVNQEFQWGVSLSGPQPEDQDFIKTTDRFDAFALRERIQFYAKKNAVSFLDWIHKHGWRPHGVSGWQQNESNGARSSHYVYDLYTKSMEEEK